MEGKIWGTNIYSPSFYSMQSGHTFWSLIKSRGLVDMAVGSAVDKFTGATQNGIESHSSDRLTRSLTFSTHAK
ncbi:hypothetical protein AK88_01793 [Plasmodium fragile]|uniref:Uncharacterized protein n=1 Tax=Plasmodium fragile TaxID=5857 RepID=A0A0D9QN79_PLAFR|nr:uncharacterized protein AK88_01793 [Plasmodium fragile]KJP88514.1 hypothetical protein AK88_01793 [Plasmodium fragile]